MTPPDSEGRHPERPALDLVQLARQHDRLRRLVVALVGDEHGAEDVVQDAWVRALQVGPQEPRALGAWLTTVSRRLASNLRRTRARRMAREEGASRPEALPSSAEIAARVELEARVIALLEALAEPHRTLLRDRYLGGLSPTELAQRDCVSLDTVKARLARARAVLRAALERAGIGGDVHWTAALAPLLVPRGSWHLAPAAPFAPGPLVSGPPVSGPLAALPAGAFPAPVALGGALVMKKALIAVCVLVCGVALLRFTGDSLGGALAPRTGSASAALEPAALTPVPPAPPASAAPGAGTEAPSAARGTRVAEATVPAAKPWRVRGRARGRGDAGFAGLPLELTFFKGYDATGTPIDTVQVSTGLDGAFTLERDEPTETQTIAVRALPRSGLHSVTYGPYIAVRGEGEPDPIDILVFPIDATVKGVVRDERGNGLSGCMIKGMFGNAKSDARGAFSMSIAASSWGGLRASAAGYGEEEVQLEGLAPGSTTEVEFRMVRGARIEGVVRDEGGRPVEGVIVGILGETTQTATTDGAGRYVLDQIKLAPPRALTPFAKRAEFPAHQSTSLQLEAGRAEYVLDLDLPGTVVAAGLVVRPDGAPVAGADVWIGSDEYSMDRMTTRSGDHGEFEFAHVSAGHTKLSASKPGFAAVVSIIELAAPQGARDLRLELGRARTLRGVVQDAAGRGLAGVSVAARNVDDAYVGQSARTDTAGRFEVTDLPPEALTVEAFARGLVRASVRVSAAATEVAVTMERAGRLSGRVVDAATGAPLHPFTVRFVRIDDPTTLRRMSGFSSSWGNPGMTFDAEDGRWSTSEDSTRLEPGTWTGVEVSAAGYAPLLLPLVEVSSVGDDAGRAACARGAGVR
ncbi:MAG: sigma-70 family RNA polymerase sigma factor [Planctomycetota bacterium]